MQREVGLHFFVGVDDGVDEIRTDVVLLPTGSRGDDALDVDLVGVEQKPHERLLVVGVGAHVGEDENAGLFSGSERGAGVEHDHGAKQNGAKGFHELGESTRDGFARIGPTSAFRERIANGNKGRSEAGGQSLRLYRFWPEISRE
jgi:hypothetical protein